MLNRVKNYGASFPIALFDHLFREYRVRKSCPYWQSLRDKHKGERGFVIGNGPSLKLDDLERLNGEVSIASNKIYLAFSDIAWRPSYFTICDRVLWGKIRRELDGWFSTVHLADHLYGVPFNLRGKTKIWRSLSRLGENNENFGFSDDLSIGVYGGGTITFENLQLAVHLGLNPIYLIGCDHYYKGEENVIQDAQVSAGDVDNHFIKGYREAGEKVNPAPIDVMNEAFNRARGFADRNGITIANATRGGHLNAFPRADFVTLFTES